MTTTARPPSIEAPICRPCTAFTTTPPELADQLVGLDIPGDANTAINAARRAAGGPLGPLGAPDGGQYSVGADGIAQNFAGGKIFYTPATGANVVMGQILAKYDSLGGAAAAARRSCARSAAEW